MNLAQTEDGSNLFETFTLTQSLLISSLPQN